MVTADGHVKGRGLARKASTHCVVFSEREKGAKDMNACRGFLSNCQNEVIASAREFEEL
jgi:hypothetical protein